MPAEAAATAKKIDFIENQVIAVTTGGIVPSFWKQ
jgi:hypothetical protein